MKGGEEEEDEEEGKEQAGKKRFAPEDLLNSEWLRESRQKYEQQVLAMGAKEGTADSWEAKAAEKWGDGIQLAKASVKGSDGRVDWKSYVKSRLCTPLPELSPFGLSQETHCDCPWKLLSSCILISRVSSVAVKERALSAFFQRYSNPTAVLETKPQDVFAIIQPLGLFPFRFKALISVAEAFLGRPVFDCGLSPEKKIYGIGQFGVDSYNIFCNGKAALIQPGDRNLQAYVRWFRSKV